MARYIGPVCKLCRREGMKLFLKGERCYTDKCSVTRRPYPPGQHGQGRIKLTEYAVRLREKQKIRRIYGVLEKQFREYYFDATRRQGPHRRADARPHREPPRQRRAPHRLRARRATRRASSCSTQHILVNGKRVDIPCYLRQAGRQDRGPREEPRDQVHRAPRSRRSSVALSSRGSRSTRRTSPARSRACPVRDELNEPPIREQYVVEYYSR